MTAKELEREFKYKQLINELKRLKSINGMLSANYNNLKKYQETVIEKEVKKQTKEYEAVIKDQENQIDALKRKIAELQSKLDNDASNSGIPTSKTPIGKKKYIPNTREKTDKPKGGQVGHKKHKLVPFKKEQITEERIIKPLECDKCHSKNLEQLNTGVDKQELDYDVKIIRRNNHFANCKCKDCGNIFHSPIPNDLKEDIQYGKTVQALSVCLTNEIYTPFNKTVKLIKGITDGEINMSEGYVAKLQKRGAKNLETFIEGTKEQLLEEPVYGWDDGVIWVNKKEAILRTYCTDKIALFIGHERKNKEGIDEDGILPNTKEQTIVMHDHLLVNYNEDYQFKNVECVIHFIRRLKKMHKNTNHSWCLDLVKLLSDTNTDRNNALKKNEVSFSDEYLRELDKKYDELIELAKEQNEEPITTNYFKDEELNFINDIKKYKKNYLLWAYNFGIPSTNNNSERSIRPVKSKLKISGEFQNIEYAQYYATIRSYIETCKRNGINIIDACVHLMNNKPYTLQEILEKGKENEKA